MSQPTKPPAQRHYDYIDGLRAILALYVVAHHCWTLVGRNSATGHAQKTIYDLALARGQDAVVFFIVVSGFCLALPVLKTGYAPSDGILGFLKRRAWRILPPYYFSIALALIWQGLRMPSASDPYWHLVPCCPFSSVLAHLLLIQNFSTGELHNINPVFWSIAVEWQIYFLFPLFLLGWRSIGMAWTLAAAVLAAVLIDQFNARYLGASNWLHFLAFFNLGMIAAYLSFSTDAICAKCRQLPWGLLTVAALLAHLGFGYFQRHLPGADFFLIDSNFCLLAVPLLIYVSVTPECWLRRLLNFRPLVFVGTFSYSLYLTHSYVMYSAELYFAQHPIAHANQTLTLVLLVGLPVSVAVSYLFFLGCERPFLVKRDRKVVPAS